MLGHLVLERFAYTERGTFGKLYVGDTYLYTVERPWVDNQRNISCVPTGSYKLEWHNSEKYPNTFALVGGTVSHYPEVGFDRSAILLHPGNTMHDLEGCIAPGLRLGVLAGEWAVLSSREAMKTIRDFNPTSLDIINYIGGKLR